VSGLVLLMGLLVLSYAGSLLVAARPGRAVGLASGTELVALGVVLGPEVLGLIGPDALAALAPVAHVALGWVGLILGVEAASSVGVRGAPGARGAFLRGFGLALATMALVALPLLAILVRFVQVGAQTSVMLALACGAACAGVLREGSHAPNAPNAPDELDDGRESDGAAPAPPDARASGADLACVLALVVVSTIAVWRGAPTAAWGLGAAGPLVGLALGAIAALLLGKTPRDDATWGVLLGVSLLAIGIAARLSLHAMAVTFPIGAMLVLASPVRGHVRALVAPTERAVLLPTLVLAGASLVPKPLASVQLVIALAFGAVAMRLLGRRLASRRLPLAEARATILGAPPIGACIGLSILLAAPAREAAWEGSRLAALPLLIAVAAGLVAEIARARARASMASASGSDRPPPPMTQGREVAR
jgi:hypothetical protein